MTADMTALQQDAIRNEAEIGPLLHRAKELCSILISKVDGGSMEDVTKDDLSAVHMLAGRLRKTFKRPFSGIMG